VCPLWVHRSAVVTAGATLVLIFVGALVTSTGSGLAVPDWPLSFGQVFPPMVGGVLFEHGHRLVAACVGLLTVTLMVLLSHWEPRAWVRWLARGAVLAVLLQGALGGVTVLFRLPLAVCTAPGWQEGLRPAPTQSRQGLRPAPTQSRQGPDGPKSGHTDYPISTPTQSRQSGGGRQSPVCP
jgi:hypothetical protein